MYRSCMGRAQSFLLTVAMCLTASAAWAQSASILNPSGLPLPRYVSLKSDKVNMRVGPGERYPIRWEYHRAGYPVQIIEEFAHWRKIRDFEGTSGWVHKNLLAGIRTALIMDKRQNLYKAADATSAPVMRADPMVAGRLVQCLPDWCEMQIGERKGWIRKADIWGVTREEVFGE